MKHFSAITFFLNMQFLHSFINGSAASSFIYRSTVFNKMVLATGVLHLHC